MAGKTALELLGGTRPERTFADKIWGPLLGGSAGLGCVAFINYNLRKPVLSGIQMYVGFALAGTVLAHYIQDYQRGHMAERDAVLRHYVELHPDDFVKPAPKKYAEVLLPWVPIR